MVKRGATLMVQGTASSVGKSALVTALCRIFRQDGLRVAPFKSQNMALNSAVTAAGGEIGRAQAEQARAAGIEPTVDMNPILLKPEAEARSQVIVLGRVWRTMSAREYHTFKPELLQTVSDSLNRLRREYELVIIEGAGSPAEINLREHEIVNMRIAHLARAPVLLVGDIDRGGVFASLVGTLALLDRRDRRRIAGFVINKFRGDVALLRPGLDMLEARTRKPVVGVIPFMREIGIAEEDSVALEGRRSGQTTGRVDIAVVKLPHIANYDDYDPLAAEAHVRFVDRPEEIAGADLIILPGTKSTVADLAWLRERGLADAVVRAVAAGTPVLGICGGYQMLGRSILDPDRVESPEPETPGLGLLDIVTRFAPTKRTVRVTGRVLQGTGPFATATGSQFDGYEIHHGRSELSGADPWLTLSSGDGEYDDGAIREDGVVAGCYIHGLFDTPSLRRAILGALASGKGRHLPPVAFDRESAFDRLADHVRGNLDLAAVRQLIKLRSSSD